MMLQGGPAARAGLLLGDRLVTVDGTAIAAVAAPRLAHGRRAHWRRPRSLRAVPDGERSRPYRRARRTSVRQSSSRSTSRPRTTPPLTRPKRACRVIRTSGQSRGLPPVSGTCISGRARAAGHARARRRLKDVDALVLDLRGRGGSAAEVTRIVTCRRANTASGRAGQWSLPGGPPVPQRQGRAAVRVQAARGPDRRGSVRRGRHSGLICGRRATASVLMFPSTGCPNTPISWS